MNTAYQAVKKMNVGDKRNIHYRYNGEGKKYYILKAAKCLGYQITCIEKKGCCFEVERLK